MTIDLAQVQEFVARAVQKRGDLAGHADVAAATPAVVAGNDRLSPVEQLDIYREQFWLRHRDVMYEDFASLAVLMGDEPFEAMVADYLEAYPPDSFTLRDLGARLGEMLASDPKFAADPLLAELARLEWAFVDAFDAKDAPPLDPSSLAAAGEDDWPRARVELHPSVQRVPLRFASHEYRATSRRFRSGEADVKPERPEAREVPLVVYRGPEKLHYIDLEPAAFALLDALAQGTPLEAACEAAALAAGIDDATALEPHVGGWFQHWTSLGWISAVRF
jgi:hypothetical protein